MLLYELDNLVTGNVVYNDTLNPKIYDENDDMRPEVHAALMAVVKNFVTDLDLPNMVVHDVILTGSSANFNWTKFSDIDLHLISDVDVFADPHMASKYFNAAKNVWNNKHDVDIRGIDVEVYVEDNDEHHESLGRFSVMNDDWITKPDHNTPVFDEAALNRKVRYIMKEIDMLMQDDDLVTDIEHLKEKIWLMRGEGLAKAGEYSVENLAFKVLRNMGYLSKILKALHDAEDRTLSVRENKMKIQEMAGQSVEEVGAMYAKYKTNDWQNRGGNYPKGGVPDSVDNAGSYGDEAFLEFSFKNTSEKQAKNWAQRFLQSKGLPSTSITTAQDGDYADDWVQVFVTYKTERVTEDDWSVADAEDDWNDGISRAYRKNGDAGVERFRADMEAKGIKDPNVGDF